MDTLLHNSFYKYLDPDTPANEVFGILSTWPEKRKRIWIHTHNFCEFMLVYSGKIKHIVNDEQQIIESYQLCFIRDFDVHYLERYDNSTICIYNIEIPNALLQDAKNYYSNTDLLFESKLPVFATLDFTEFKYISQKIDEFNDYAYEEKRGILFKSLLSDFFSLLLSHNTNAHQQIPNWFSNLLSDMSQPENFIAGLPRMLALSNYSQEYINRCFRKYLKTTPTTYINSLRIKYAQKLLSEKNLSIADTCFASGFQTAGYFYKEFQKYTHCSPKEFVKKVTRNQDYYLSE